MSDRRSRRDARKAERRARKAARKVERGGSSFQRRTARKAARTDKKQGRRDARMQARQGRVEARKARGLARIAAKQESGFWSPEAVASRQGTLGGALDMGGEILGGLLGSGESEAEAWDQAGYSEAAGFEEAYPDEYEDEMGEVIKLDVPESQGLSWPIMAAIGGAGLVGLYMVTKTTKKGDRRKTARRAFM